MFPEYQELIIHLRNTNPQFQYVYNKYEEIHNKIKKLQRHKSNISDHELQELKKEKLLLKDQAYLMLQKANGNS